VLPFSSFDSNVTFKIAKDSGTFVPSGSLIFWCAISQPALYFRTMHHRLHDPFEVTGRSFDPVRMIFVAGAILFVCILVGLILPATLFRATGTFEDKDILNKMSTITAKATTGIEGESPDTPINIWNKYQSKQQVLEDALDSLNQRLSKEALATMSPHDILLILQARYQLHGQLEQLRSHPPIHISGYYLEKLMWVWPIFYTCLAWLIFLIAPKCPRTIGRGTMLTLFFGMLILYRWPTWIRNINRPYLRYYKRLVYANGNWDISWQSFFVQELQAVIACVLLVWLWIQWADLFKYWRQEVDTCWPSILSQHQLPEFLEMLTALFVRWQISSLILAGAFLPYTFFFWTYVIDYGDQRYIAHALIMHLLWGVTWLLLSLPLAWTWYQWSVRYRLYSLREGSITPETSKAERNDPQSGEPFSLPINPWNAVGSVAGALATFAFPLFKELFKHLA
jgi:hypothetical protein